MSENVEIFEVGPRDGLQNESHPIATRDKIALVDLLSGAGFSRIEVASFVRPDRVPQMADGADVLAGIARAQGVSYAALTPNMRGLDRAIAARADEVSVFASASQGFSQANINCSISDSLARYAPLVRAARDVNVLVRGYVSCVTDCPFDGPTPPSSVASVARALMGMGCYEISLGDTIGRGTPDSIGAMLRAVLEHIPAARLAGHYHDTAGRALDNVDASLALGVRVFDAAVGGLGGCPYAPGAPGNVATENLHDHLIARGYKTGLDRDVVIRAGALAGSLRGPTGRPKNGP